jgi:hypothetical protein
MENYLYHTSMDLNLEEKEFTPRIPRYICAKENNTIDRICVCERLSDTIGALPHKGYLINDLMRNRNEVYLTYYAIEKDKVKYMDNTQVKKFVDDAHLTGECWILNSFKAAPKMIKIKKLTLDRYNKYTNNYYGFTKEFEYENSIENHDRTFEYTFADKNIFKEAIKFAKDNNIQYKVLEDKYHHLWHKTFCFNNMSNYNGTTKKYRLRKVQFNVTADIDIAKLWLINNKQYELFDKKNIRIKPFIINDDDFDIMDYLMDYY